MAKPVDLLPEPIRQPVATEAALGQLRGARRAAAARLVGDRPVFLRVRTRSWADIGGWLGPRPIDLFATDRGLAMVAAGRFDFEGPAPLEQCVPYTDLRDSTYNYATGRLIFSPAERSPIKSVRIGPADAQQLLAQIHHEGT